MEMPRYTFPVTLIPGGCPQFLDFAVDMEAMDQKLVRFSRSFREERRPGTEGNGRENFLLHCIEENDQGQWIDRITGAPSPPSSYEIDSRKCLDAYFDQWVPLPFLRIRDMKRPDGAPMFETGPSNWARCRLVRPKDGSRSIRVILAFDTTVEKPPHEGEHYFALSPNDVAANAVFSLAWHVRDNTWFLNSSWVDRWLFALRESWLAKSRKRSGDSYFVMEYLAEYLTFIELLQRLLPDTRMRVINPDRDVPVDVDLILDIGNSRTTGILVETPPQHSTNLNNSYLMQIRDLSEPENIYTDPFATRIEFAEASFGDDAYSKLSGRRTPAFPWASAVRMGPEAARLATRAKSAEGTTGMSSPKRYLWDERIWKPTWRFNTGGDYEPMVTRGSFAKQVNHMGTPLACFDDPAISRHPLYRNQEREIAFESQFTRSSIMMFLLGEVIMQTLVTINSPAQRSRRELSDLPRRLRRIVFTVPSGMPIAEQRIYRRWVNFAVRTVWEAMGWDEWYVSPHVRSPQGRRDYRQSPETRCSWDEASCTQIVYIYNEIIYKYHGDAHLFFRLFGKSRPKFSPYPSLRVASIDVGGGTTDLSIATYSLDNDESSAARVRPHLGIRDGFNVAGDDILRNVISDCLLTAIAKAASAQGVANARLLLGECFGRDVLDNSQENKNLRAQFTRQIAQPIGLALLSAYEKSDPLRSPPVTFALRDFFEMPIDPWKDDDENEVQVSLPFAKAPQPSQAVIDYVEKTVKRAAPGSGFSLMDVQVTMAPAVVENAVTNAMQRILSDLSEVIRLYDCDVLLLSGRPSKLHGVIAAVVARQPVPVDRIIPMCEYRVGRWYPFVDHLGMITDPKTTVSMGAILCALSEGHLEGFSFATAALALTSTARFIGEMDTTGRLANAKIWFEADVDSGKEQDLEKDVQFTGPLSVGFRQFPVERWPTTRFYLMDFATEEDRRTALGKLPYTVTMRFLQRGVDDSTVQGEVDEGELSVVSVTDSQGNEPRGGKKAVEVRLQTLPLDEGYWLDTGVLISS